MLQTPHREKNKYGEETEKCTHLDRTDRQNIINHQFDEATNLWQEDEISKDEGRKKRRESTNDALERRVRRSSPKLSDWRPGVWCLSKWWDTEKNEWWKSRADDLRPKNIHILMVSIACINKQSVDHLGSLVSHNLFTPSVRPVLNHFRNGLNSFDMKQIRPVKQKLYSGLSL